MKAEEIRKLELFPPPDPSCPGGPIIRDETFFLQEIAAQFADLNERLDGFITSMVLLTKAVNELNAELRNPKITRKRIPWGTDKLR